MENYGSFEYTRKVLEGLDQKVRQEVEKLGGNVHLVKLMDDLKNWKWVLNTKSIIKGPTLEFKGAHLLFYLFFVFLDLLEVQNLHSSKLPPKYFVKRFW